MALPSGIGIVDTMIGFPAEDFRMYDFIRAQLKESSADFEFPVEYMFKGVPKELYGSGDPIALTLKEMDRFGVEMGLIGVGGEVSAKALKDHPDRFIPRARSIPIAAWTACATWCASTRPSASARSPPSTPASIPRSASPTPRCIRSTPSASNWMYRSFPAPAFRGRACPCGRRRCGSSTR